MSKRIPMTCIILAGGKSSRMGKDKALLPFGQETVLEYLGNLADSIFEQTLIAAGDKSKYRFLYLPEEFFCEDIVRNRGPLGGIAAGFAHAVYSTCFVMTCDMPLIDEVFIRKMIKAWKGDPWDALCVENTGGAVDPFPGVYTRENRSLVRVLLDLGHLSMHRLFEVISVDKWPLPPEFRDAMVNMNEPGDYELVMAKRKHFHE